MTATADEQPTLDGSELKRGPRENVYKCESCKSAVVTVDVDSGVTPFMIGCVNGCGGSMQSHFYPIRQPGWPKAVLEWYKPGPKEYAHLAAATKAHVDNGGLLMRNRTNAKPVNYGEEELPREERPETWTRHDNVVLSRMIGRKVGRNDLCPCGSGVKFKRCCEGRERGPRG